MHASCELLASSSTCRDLLALAGPWHVSYFHCDLPALAGPWHGLGEELVYPLLWRACASIAEAVASRVVAPGKCEAVCVNR